MKIKKFIAFLSAVIILVAAVVAVRYGYRNYQTTNVEVTKNQAGDDVYFTYNNIEPDGVADKIVEANVHGIAGENGEILANNTNAVNNVAAIVFDFRGYDTLGESFILLTAIAGTFVILSRHKKAKKEAADETKITEKEEA